MKPSRVGVGDSKRRNRNDPASNIPSKVRLGRSIAWKANSCLDRPVEHPSPVNSGHIEANKGHLAGIVITAGSSGSSVPNALVTATDRLDLH
jgi:hypothetical protein